MSSEGNQPTHPLELCVIEGDGIGREVIPAAVKILLQVCPDVVIHPINHASLVLTWNGKTIYNDPVGASTLYTGLPRADLILGSHGHSDHFSSTTMEAVRGTNCVILAPSAVYNSLTPVLRPLAAILTNNTSTNLLGLSVDAIPAYNSNHPLGRGNGYVLTIGGKYSIFLMSSGNYIERAIAGLRPDVALIAPLFSNNTHAFTPRLVKALNYPKIVLPTHWDDFEAPLSEPPKDLRGIYGDVANLDLWVKEMKSVSPKSRIITTKYFGSYAP